MLGVRFLLSMKEWFTFHSMCIFMAQEYYCLQCVGTMAMMMIKNLVTGFDWDSKWAWNKADFWIISAVDKQ